MRAHSVVAFAVLCGIATRTTYARAQATVVVVVGKAQANDRATVASAVRSAARSSGWELVETPLTEVETTTILACLQAPQRWACMSPLPSAKGIQRVIVVNIEPERAPGDSGALVITERILLSGSDVPTSNRRPCLKCTAEALARITFDLTKGLLEEASAGTGRTKLRVTSVPQGAWITLDNTSAGLTDHTYSTFPGRHVVILQRDGYQIETRNVDVVENQDTVVSVTLRAQGGAVSSSSVTSPEPSYLLPAIVGGAGLAAVAAGVGLQLAKDPPAVGQDQSSRLVSVPGVILIAGGSLAIGAGVYLWAHTTHKAASASVPTVTPTAGGGIVGWTGHF